MEKEVREARISELIKKEKYDFDDLVLITELLRSEGGCPWDMEQTHKSTRNNFIEETYEVIEAIDTENSELLREELGDVLLQVVFHARMEEEEGRFDMNDVSNDICVKLIHRHPHIFGEVKAENTDEVLANWEQIKNEEKSRVTYTDKLRAIPPMFPALVRAQKVGKKTSFFDFESSDEVIDKIYEEIDEVRSAIAEGDQAHIDEEIGDLIFTVVSLARHTHSNAEESLMHATDKYIDRFEKIEKYFAALGRDVADVTMKELDEVWDKIKHSDTL